MNVEELEQIVKLLHKIDDIVTEAAGTFTQIYFIIDFGYTEGPILLGYDEDGDPAYLGHVNIDEMT